MSACKRMRLSCPTILDLPNELLMRIFKLAGSDASLSQTCSRFNDVINVINAKTLSLNMDVFNLINPNFDLDKFIRSANISLEINRKCGNLKQIELFFQTYGHLVTKLIINIERFPSKFLSMLPNLEDLELDESLAVDDYVSHDFPKPLRRLKIGSFVNLKRLDFTVLDELELHQSFGDLSAKTNSLRKYEQLKKVAVIGCDMSYDMKQSIRRMQLESLRYRYENASEQKIFCLSLKSQRFLRELVLDGNVSVKVWMVICENLLKLESLTIGFNERFSPDNFCEISSLKSLKSLKVVDKISRGCFDVLLKGKFDALTSLSLEIAFTLSSNEVTRLARNLTQLASLSLTFKIIILHETILTVFEQFNELETLTLNFSFIVTYTDNDLERFHTENHQNLNLKSLNFHSYGPHQEIFIRKFIRDFPHLEAIGLNSFIYNRHHLELLLTGLRRLKIINELSIKSEELYEAFLRYGANLEEFSIDINLLEDPSSLIKDSNVTFSEVHSLSKISRVKRGEEKTIGVNFHEFSRWQSLRTMMVSTKQIKHLNVRLRKFPNKTAFENIVKCLKAISTSVTSLVLENVSSSSQLNYILESFSSVESLKIRYSVLETDQRDATKVCGINNAKLSSFCVLFNHMEDARKSFSGMLENLFHAIKFAKDSLTSFKLIVGNRELHDSDFFAEKLEKHLENQRKLRKKYEHWDKHTMMLVIHFTAG